MTTLDALATPDALALLAAIDAGDDSALPALADLLEEAGDGRAAGLRAAGGRRPADFDANGNAGWLESWRRGPASLPADVFLRVAAGRATGRHGDELHVVFATRSAAFLALAEALADG